MTGEPRSLLLVRLSAMGDVVQSLGAVASLREARPHWRLTFVTQEQHAPLLEGMDGLARVVRFDRRGGVRALARLWRELRRERYDVALDLQGNWKSVFVARLSGARRCIGMAAPWRQEPLSRLLLREVVRAAAVPHPARAAWELARHVAPEAPFRWPRLAAAPSEIADEEVALAAAGIDPQRPFRVVVVSDERDPRALRAAAVAAEARRREPVLFIAGPDDAAAALPEGRPGMRHARGELRRLIALGCIVAAAGGDVLGPDQGATHVLLACGAIGRVVFGSQDPARTAPPGAVALVRRDAPSCRPCRRRGCANPRGVECMDFSPDDGLRVDVGLPQRGARGG